MRRATAACVLLMVLAGCESAPFAHEEVEALVEPGDRAVAFIPFAGNRARGITLVDGITLAELAAMQLRTARPKLAVLGPSDMRDTLRKGLNEARWHEIARETGATLLVVGEITFLDVHYDKMLQSREGTVGLRFRILDAAAFPPKPLAKVNWRFGFPEDVGAKFDAKYTSMDDKTFRRELLQYGAGHVAGAFYTRYVKRTVATRLDVTWRKDHPIR